MPHLYLVSPSHHLADGRLVKTTRYWTSGLTMPTLDALAPRDWKVDIVDELMLMMFGMDGQQTGCSTRP